MKLIREWVRMLLERDELGYMWMAYQKYRYEHDWPDLSRRAVEALHTIANADPYEPVLHLDRAVYHPMAKARLIHSQNERRVIELTGRGHGLHNAIMAEIPRYKVEEHYAEHEEYIQPGEKH